jgi:activating signal cointegrator complex subunit 1
VFSEYVEYYLQILTCSDLANAEEAVIEELGRLVPMYEDLAATSKVHLLQSIVSRVLVDMVFEAYFVGLSGEQEHQFAHLETLLGSFGKALSRSSTGVGKSRQKLYLTQAYIATAGSPESINQWRSLTLTILKKDVTQKMQEQTKTITETIILRVNRILDAITETEATEARDQGLRALVTSSIELSRLLVVQKAVFKAIMPEILPHQRITFDPATMEDIGGEDEDDLLEREICCITFPGIMKRGDENGGQLQFRNVISKAWVLCSPE